MVACMGHHFRIWLQSGSHFPIAYDKKETTKKENTKGVAVQYNG